MRALPGFGPHRGHIVIDIKSVKAKAAAKTLPGLRVVPLGTRSKKTMRPIDKEVRRLIELFEAQSLGSWFDWEPYLPAIRRISEIEEQRGRPMNLGKADEFIRYVMTSRGLYGGHQPKDA
jgi:hypothetical protein